MKAIIEVSVSSALKANNAINDSPFFSENLEQQFSNVWETIEFDEDDEDEEDRYFDVVFGLEDLFKRTGISEYGITKC